MELAESLCSLVVEHTHVPDYTSSHPCYICIRGHSVSQRCVCVACMVFISLVHTATLVTPCIKYEMAGIFSNITRFATKF